MADLRHCLAALGCVDVQTLLQSGNLVFRTDRPGGAKLEEFLEAEFLERLGISTDVMVRSAAQWRKMIARNPFVKEAREDPGHLLAIISRQPVTRKTLADLRAAMAGAAGHELAAESNGQLYLFYPGGVGRSRVTTALLERALGTRVTGRNWNTVLKLAEACSS